VKKIVGLVFTLLLSVTTLAGVQAFNSSNVNLGIFSQVKCSTGLTCTKSGSRLNIVSSPSLSGTLTLSNNETMSNNTDDTITFASEDEATTLQVLGFEAKSAALQLWADQGDDAADKYSFSVDTSGVLSMAQAGAAFDLKFNAFEATDAKITLQADESDDNGDDWEIKAAASGNALTISNDTSGSQVAKVTIGTDGDFTGPGTGTMHGFLKNQIASTTTTLTAAQCGSSIVGAGAHVLTLPEASTVLGCRYTIVSGTADDLDINPNDGTDQIAHITASGGTITPAAGDAIRLTDIGSSVTIEAIGANLWAVVAHNGAITDVN
jgi:hypothetical protein